MNKENKLLFNNVLYAVLFLVLGIILLTSTEDIISIVSKVIGSVLTLIGIVKAIKYIYMKGKTGDYSPTELVISLLLICGGTLLILSSNALGFAIRIIVGLWAIFASINRMVISISVKSEDKIGFRMYLITSIIMLFVGVIIISGIFDKFVGILIIIYSVSEIVNYIYSRVSEKDFKPKKNVKKKNSIKNKKRIKNSKVMDAIVEDTKEKN